VIEEEERDSVREEEGKRQMKNAPGDGPIGKRKNKEERKAKLESI